MIYIITYKHNITCKVHKEEVEAYDRDNAIAQLFGRVGNNYRIISAYEKN